MGSPSQTFFETSTFYQFSLSLTLSEVCYISSKYWLPNKSADKIFLHKTLYSPVLFKKKLRCPSQNLLETSTLYTFLLVFTVEEVCYIWNKYQPPNNLSKYQYFCKRNFLSLLHFEEKLSLSIANIFRSNHFLLLFHCSWQWMMFAIFQMNTHFLINQLEKYFYPRHVTLLLHCKKIFALSIAEVSWKIDFLPYFYLF